MIEKHENLYEQSLDECTEVLILNDSKELHSTMCLGLLFNDLMVLGKRI